MKLPSEELFKLMIAYLKIVDSGDLGDKRSEAHDAMMRQMRCEGWEFEDRNEARELARLTISTVKKLAELL
jgi:hypothetical protein